MAELIPRYAVKPIAKAVIRRTQTFLSSLQSLESLLLSKAEAATESARNASTAGIMSFTAALRSMSINRAEAAYFTVAELIAPLPAPKVHSAGRSDCEKADTSSNALRHMEIYEPMSARHSMLIAAQPQRSHQSGTAFSAVKTFKSPQMTATATTETALPSTFERLSETSPVTLLQSRSKADWVSVTLSMPPTVSIASAGAESSIAVLSMMSSSASAGTESISAKSIENTKVLTAVPPAC